MGEGGGGRRLVKNKRSEKDCILSVHFVLLRNPSDTTLQFSATLGLPVNLKFIRSSSDCLQVTGQ